MGILQYVHPYRWIYMYMHVIERDIMNEKKDIRNKNIKIRQTQK